MTPYLSGAHRALTGYAVSKFAALKLAPVSAKPQGLGNRGIHHSMDIRINGKRVGDVDFIKHPEGPAEVTGFFIDDAHRGKGYGQEALRQLLQQHGAIISDTRMGTTRAAQRAMKRLAEKSGLPIKDIPTRELGGGIYEDMDGNPTAIWYAQQPGASGFSDKQLQDIEHNARYHRRREARGRAAAALGFTLGGGLGFLGSPWNGVPRAALTAAAGLGGGLLSEYAVNRAQYHWDRPRNLRGDW